MEAVRYVAQLANVALAIASWMIIGRLLLTALMGTDDRHVVLTALRRLTEPAYRVVRWVTRDAASERLVPWLALAALLVLRLMLVPVLRLTQA